MKYSVIFFVKQFYKLNKQLLIPIFLITILSGTLDQIISMALENELRNPDGASSKVWYYASASLANSLMFPWLETLLLLFWWHRQLQNENSKNSSWLTSWAEFIHKFASQSLIETLRSWGKCLAYSVLLILPGLWKFLEYSYVPWIVCFHPDYEKGKLDALKTSTHLFRKSWFKVLCLMIIFSVVIPLIFTSYFEHYRLIWISPIPALALHLANALLQILCFQFFTQIFFKVLAKENPHESHI